ncbi:hypothetical protein DPMN_181329 [Dreissena polymorpha]|uniref:Uncharacterized protein n=1 Tax=Dreissena polymorpha TaxID=45954 RepID=A0A9D4DDH3_DREPO|nr:hypothetical protein DPMN_181329 [Dreissena polymorpha]
MAGIIDDMRRSIQLTITNKLRQARHVDCTTSYQEIKDSLINCDDDEKEKLLDSLKEHESALEDLIKNCERAKDENKMRLEVLKSMRLEVLESNVQKRIPRGKQYARACVAFGMIYSMVLRFKITC